MAEHRARGKWFGRGRTRALLSLGMVLGLGAVATSAYWTEQSDVAGATLRSGAMHIDLAANNGVKPETYSWAAMALTDLAPGTSVAKVLPVSNNSVGPVTFTYRIQSSASGALGAALRVTVRRGGSVSGTSCTGGTLVGAAGAALDGFDQPAGDALAPNQSHGLCVQVALPAPSNLAPGSSSAITFTFPATQVPS